MLIIISNFAFIFQKIPSYHVTIRMKLKENCIISSLKNWKKKITEARVKEKLINYDAFYLPQ